MRYEQSNPTVKLGAVQVSQLHPNPPQVCDAEMDDVGLIGSPMRQPNRKKWTRATKAQMLDQPAFVYFFVHASEPRVKVGVSLVPLKLLSQLPECHDINMDQSWVVAMPDARRVYEVERVLHKALAPSAFQIRSRGVHDGKTEWFRLDALPVAIRLLQSVPCAGKAVGTFTPVPLSSMTAGNSLLACGSDGAGKRFESAEQHNLRVAGEVCQRLLFVADHLPVRLQPIEPKDQLDVVFKGFRQWGMGVRSIQRPSIEVWRQRSAVVDLESYGLQRGQERAGATSVVPPCLITMIGYDRLEPDSLRIRLAAVEHIQALPAGRAMCAHLNALTAQLELVCAQASFSQLALRSP